MDFVANFSHIIKFTCVHIGSNLGKRTSALRAGGRIGPTLLPKTVLLSNITSPSLVYYEQGWDKSRSMLQVGGGYFRTCAKVGNVIRYC